jgi:hypothetical protein
MSNTSHRRNEDILEEFEVHQVENKLAQCLNYVRKINNTDTHKNPLTTCLSEEEENLDDS